MSPEYLARRLKRLGLPVPDAIAIADFEARRARMRRARPRPQGRPRKDGARWPNGRLKPPDHSAEPQRVRQSS